MPDKLTDERLREIERVPLPTLREIAVGPVVTTATQAEVESMARELLALRARGEAAPVAWGLYGQCDDDPHSLWRITRAEHHDGKPSVAEVIASTESEGIEEFGPFTVEPLYAAPPPEAPGVRDELAFAMDAIDLLNDRGGFDDWWDSIGGDIRQEIITAIAAKFRQRAQRGGEGRDDE